MAIKETVYGVGTGVLAFLLLRWGWGFGSGGGKEAGEGDSAVDSTQAAGEGDSAVDSTQPGETTPMIEPQQHKYDFFTLRFRPSERDPRKVKVGESRLILPNGKTVVIRGVTDDGKPDLDRYFENLKQVLTEARADTLFQDVSQFYLEDFVNSENNTPLAPEYKTRHRKIAEGIFKAVDNERQLLLKILRTRDINRLLNSRKNN